MHKKVFSLLWVGIALIPLLGGCGRDHNAARLVVPDRLDRGLVVVLPGIEGTGPLNRGIRDGLADGGVPTAIRIHDWTLGPILAPLSQMWEGRARSEADSLASSIRAYQGSHPGKPVVLVGHSGGCAVALFALEKLGDTRVASVILLAPSVSPSYNLKPAMEHVDGLVYSFHSSKDIALLGVGTWVFGTIDGKHTTSAGLGGFVTAGENGEIYKAKLRQVGWQPAMQLSGNAGGHTDWADRRFVRDYVAPRVNFELKAHATRSPAPRLATPGRG